MSQNKGRKSSTKKFRAFGFCQGNSSGKILSSKQITNARLNANKIIFETADARQGNASELNNSTMGEDLAEGSGDFNWGDDAMDVEDAIDGAVPVDLSHAGGEFYDIVQDAMHDTR
jgi:hypothetical protein